MLGLVLLILSMPLIIWILWNSVDGPHDHGPGCFV